MGADRVSRWKVRTRVTYMFDVRNITLSTPDTQCTPNHGLELRPSIQRCGRASCTPLPHREVQAGCVSAFHLLCVHAILRVMRDIAGNAYMPSWTIDIVGVFHNSSGAIVKVSI